MGKLRKYIIPYTAVAKNPESNSIENSYKILLSSNDKIIPIIVVINPRSGAQTGQLYLRGFYNALNPIQVIDISRQELPRIKIFSQTKNAKILVCGGDGTIASVLAYLYEQKKVDDKYIPPPVGILPLGTGNDLSQCLHWGKRIDPIPSNMEELQNLIYKTLKNIGNAYAVLLDRWDVTFYKQDRPSTQSKVIRNKELKKTIAN